jgi:hypothetical protein
MATQEAPEPATPADTAELTFVAGGADWTVRVLGRAGGSAPARVPMLLLGFWEGDGEGGDAGREALVVGRTLQDLSPEEVQRAFASSRPPRPRDELPGEEARGGRRRGGAGRRRSR